MDLYIRENRSSGYACAGPWCKWLVAHTITVAAHVGNRLGDAGFISDPPVVSDAMETQAEVQATFFVVTVYCITAL